MVGGCALWWLLPVNIGCTKSAKWGTIGVVKGENPMLASIRKLEGTQAVCLPETILNGLFLKENDMIDITTENDSIVIRKAERKRRAIKSLAERFEGYTGDYQCFEADTGKPVGEEAW